MRNLKMQIVCGDCGKVSPIVDCEVYSSQKTDNLSPIFRWIFFNDWAALHLDIVCSTCADKESQ